MANNQKINGVQPKEAETKEERLILGIIKEEANNIDYGSFNLEITIKKGQITLAKTTQRDRNYNLHNLV